MSVEKLSITLPSELVQIIRDQYPSLKLSQAIAELVRCGLGLQTGQIINPDSKMSYAAVMHPIIIQMMRDIAKEEIKKFEQGRLRRIHDIFASEDLEIQSENGWMTQKDLKNLLPENIPESTRRALVSKAVAAKDLETNGEARNKCRIKVSSALDWLKQF